MHTFCKLCKLCAIVVNVLYTFCIVGDAFQTIFDDFSEFVDDFFAFPSLKVTDKVLSAKKFWPHIFGPINAESKRRFKISKLLQIKILAILVLLLISLTKIHP